LVTRPYMVSRTHTYNKIVQIDRSTLRLSNSWQQHIRMEKLAENDLTYFYLRHVVIVVTAVTTISLPPVPIRHPLTHWATLWVYNMFSSWYCWKKICRSPFVNVIQNKLP
jgi:hypothetical protein